MELKNLQQEEGDREAAEKNHEALANYGRHGKRDWQRRRPIHTELKTQNKGNQ